MRGLITVAVMINLISFQAFAVLKNTDSFYQESEKLIKDATTKKSFTEKSKIFLKLKKSFESTLTEYKKQNPKEPTLQEKEVSLLYAMLAPAFELAKSKKSPTFQECARKKHAILSGNNAETEETPTPDKDTQEALKWLNVLCDEYF